MQILNTGVGVEGNQKHSVYHALPVIKVAHITAGLNVFLRKTSMIHPDVIICRFF